MVNSEYRWILLVLREYAINSSKVKLECLSYLSDFTFFLGDKKIAFYFINQYYFKIMQFCIVNTFCSLNMDIRIWKFIFRVRNSRHLSFFSFFSFCLIILDLSKDTYFISSARKQAVSMTTGRLHLLWKFPELTAALQKDA